MKNLEISNELTNNIISFVKHLNENNYNNKNNNAIDNIIILLNNEEGAKIRNKIFDCICTYVKTSDIFTPNFKKFLYEQGESVDTITLKIYISFMKDGFYKIDNADTIQLFIFNFVNNKLLEISRTKIIKDKINIDCTSGYNDEINIDKLDFIFNALQHEDEGRMMLNKLHIASVLNELSIDDRFIPKDMILFQKAHLDLINIIFYPMFKTLYFDKIVNYQQMSKMFAYTHEWLYKNGMYSLADLFNRKSVAEYSPLDDLLFKELKRTTNLVVNSFDNETLNKQLAKIMFDCYKMGLSLNDIVNDVNILVALLGGNN